MTAATYPVARIEALALERKLSLRGLSAAAGFHANYLAGAKRMIGGTVDAEAALKIAKVLQLPLAELAAASPPTAAIPPAPDAAPPAASAPAEPGLQRLPLACLAASRLNPRRTFDADALVLLAQSIAEQGLLQNLVVRREPEQPALYWIVAGERRYRALVSLEAQGLLPAELAAGIPCRVVVASDAEHVALAILENLQRQDVNPMEEAQGFKTLMALDPKRWTTATIAQRIGMTRRHVQLRLQLCEKLAPEAAAALAAGTLPLAYARALTAAAPKEQAKLLKTIAGYRTADELRREVQKIWIPVERAIFPLDGLDPALFVEDPDTGARYFRDKKKFLSFQVPAVERLEAELKTRFAWVERRSYGSGLQNEYPAPTDPARAGAVVVFSEYDGSASVHEGLGPSRYDRQHDTPEELTRRERIADATRDLLKEVAAERDAFRAALAAKVTQLDALRLMLYTAVAPHGWDETVLDTHPAPPAPLFAGTLKSLARCLAPAKDGRQRVADGKHAQAWKAIAALPMGELLAALTEIVASQLKIDTRPPLHPAIAFLRQTTNTPLPAGLKRTDAETKAEIARRAGIALTPIDSQDLADEGLIDDEAPDDAAEEAAQ